jgi:signal transduction histidine kinase
VPIDAADRDLLRRIPLFSALPEDDLDWIATGALGRELAPGQVLAAEGDPGDALYAIAAGELEVVKQSRSAEVPIARLGPGEIVGEMAVLEARARNASVRAVVASRVIEICRDDVLELVQTRPSAALSIIRTVMGRLRNTEALLREREKLAALGTLSAGLAHELNNPAAAVQRSARLLRESLDRWASATHELGRVVTGAEDAILIGDLGLDISRLASTGGPADPLDRADRADDIEARLESAGVPDAGSVAAVLVDGGWDPDRIDAVARAFPGQALPTVIAWLASGSETETLVNEVALGATRISEIVRAVKDYTYMDQAPVQRVDVRTGIDNTLVILRPKLKDGVEVVRDYAPDLPLIEAFGSELNQVWTNLIDNAIDAMDGHGRVAISARVRDAELVVEVCDNGPGMPPEVRERIFEPFYTTKPPGSGTGLGLHISYSVVARHGGRIDVRSKPGETCFEVALPIEHRAG